MEEELLKLTLTNTLHEKDKNLSLENMPTIQVGGNNIVTKMRFFHYLVLKHTTLN